MNPDDKAVPLTQEEGNVAIIQGHDGPQLVQGNVVGARQARQSHLCCGCCCDTRRAVIVVNVISMCVAALAIGLTSMAIGASGRYASDFDDDEYVSAFAEIDGKAIGLSIGVLVVGMICQATGIYGAQKFNKIGVIIGAIWHALQCIFSIAIFDIAGAIMSGFFCYPHVAFLLELNNGIMTPEKYPNEALCCACCV